MLKKNLSQNLGWAAQIVASEATREKRRGGTFQQLVAKVYEVGEGDSEGEVSQGNSKLKKSQTCDVLGKSRDLTFRSLRHRSLPLTKFAQKMH